MNLTSKTEILTTISADWERALTIAKGVDASKIELVNTGRSIGLKLQSLAGKNQISFAYFHSLEDELPKSLSFESARKCVKLASSLKNPVATIAEANRAEQMMLEATGISEPRKRLGLHTSRDLPPATFFFSVFTDAREKITKKLSTIEDWDDDAKESVRGEIARAEKWIEEVKGKIA